MNDRGQRLLTVEYLCEQAPRALLFWQHGYGEHVGRYRSGALFASNDAWSPKQSTLPLACSASSTHKHCDKHIRVSSFLPAVFKGADCAWYYGAVPDLCSHSPDNLLCGCHTCWCLGWQCTRSWLAAALQCLAWTRMVTAAASHAARMIAHWSTTLVTWCAPPPLASHSSLARARVGFAYFRRQAGLAGCAYSAANMGCPCSSPVDNLDCQKIRRRIGVWTCAQSALPPALTTAEELRCASV